MVKLLKSSFVRNLTTAYTALQTLYSTMEAERTQADELLRYERWAHFFLTFISVISSSVYLQGMFWQVYKMNISNLCIALHQVFLYCKSDHPLQFIWFSSFTNAPFSSFCAVYNPNLLPTSNKSDCSPTKSIKWVVILSDDSVGYDNDGCGKRPVPSLSDSRIIPGEHRAFYYIFLNMYKWLFKLTCCELALANEKVN